MNLRMNGKAKGIAYIVVATLGFSLIPVLATLGLNSGFTASTLLFYRFAIAATIFLIYAAVKRISLRLSGKALLFTIGAGLIYTVQCLCYFTAFNYISASIGAVLYNTFPVFVLILSYFFLAEKITFPKILGVVTAIAGTAVILYAPWETPELLGIALIIATAFISGCYMVYNKKNTASVDSVVLTTYICIVCSFGFLAYSVVTGEFEMIDSPRVLLNVSLLAFWSTVIGLFGFMKAISLLNVGLVSVINLSEPIFTVLLSIAILSESLTFQQIVGSLIVISGIYIYEYHSIASGKLSRRE